MENDQLLNEILSIKYEIWDLDRLIPYARNPRKNDHVVDKMASQIKEFGMPVPICIRPDGSIVDGHLRYKACKKIGLTRVPVAINETWSTEKIKAFRISVNKSSEWAEWDNEFLSLEINELLQCEYNIDNLGFSQNELNEIFNSVNFNNEELDDSEEIPSLNNICKTTIGDIWILGNHRLMCGDSTNPLNVNSLLNNIEPIIMITDPPYGVNYDPEWRENHDLGIGKRSKGKVENDDKIDWMEAYSLFTGNICYIWHSAKYTHIVAKNIEDCGFKIINQIIWSKQHFALSRGDYHWQHEPCWYAVKDGKNHNWQGARDQSTVWEIKNNNSFGNSEKEETWGHGTQKPIECMLRPILNNTKINDYVYDPFGGSGTTLIACDKTNRKCLMMELSPNYCDVIVLRWQKLTGKKAILESNGKHFDEI